MAFTSGFDISEAKQLIALAANLEGATPPLDLPAIPVSWGAAPIFSSPEMGAYSNKWQLWQDPGSNRYALVIRGTIDTTGSIFEDLMAVMIPAAGSMPLASVSLPYRLAEDTKAAVHLGFFLGMGVILFDGTSGVLRKLQDLPAGSQIFIAGHSQGAAIATLVRSFLQYSDLLRPKSFSFKTYLFAQPKPGNDHFAWDFESIACDPPMAFRIANSQDWVPQVPATFQLLRGINEPNPLDYVTGGVLFKFFADGIDTLRQHLTEVHLAKHLVQIKALDEILKNQGLQPVAPIGSAAIQIEQTLNFVNCGAPMTVVGEAGQNPSDPKDFFWQHHASMYFDLLSRLGESG